MKWCLYMILFCNLLNSSAWAQSYETHQFTRGDTLRGALSRFRDCYDIHFYHLDIRFDPARQSVSGCNLFRFTAVRDFDTLQFDLYANLAIARIEYKGKPLPFFRSFNAVFVRFPSPVPKGCCDSFRVFYSGQPRIARNAPWDGGIVYQTDTAGKPWLATACEGAGASIWWPNKDHLSDEPDSMLISISVPSEVRDVSNGRLRGVTALPNGYSRYDWFVSNPINNYDISANIGAYTEFRDSFQGEKGTLDLDYWVLPEHLRKAKAQFRKNVKPMLQAFEYWFGPYPFYEDGYKLVETPYLGMEHQSAIAYGNHFRNGYLGYDLSQTGWGKKWDYIIIHESAHEWFGNNITASDLADLWIHESFACYAEALFVEYRFGPQAGREYLFGLRRAIANAEPVIGPYQVNKEGSEDMYSKGAVLLHMIRTLLDDDSKWRLLLQGLNHNFYHGTVNYEDVTGYISKMTGIDLSAVFDQYLHYASLPTFQVRWIKGRPWCRWEASAAGFNMPLRVRVHGRTYQTVHPALQFRPLPVEGATENNLEADNFNFYVLLSGIKQAYPGNGGHQSRKPS